MVLGWALSYHKAQLGTVVHWIGYTLQVDQTAVVAKIKADFMTDFRSLTLDIMKNRYVSLDALRSYAGKANHIAALIMSWRPFLDQIWAALSSQRPSNAPVNRIWVKQVATSLAWLLTFLDGNPGELSRTWRFDFFITCRHTS